MEVSLYRIATVDPATLTYAVNPSLSLERPSLPTELAEVIDSSDSRDLAIEIANLIAEKDPSPIAPSSLSTSEAIYEPLVVGIYLLKQKNDAVQNYNIAPVLISLPLYVKESATWQYILDINPKVPSLGGSGGDGGGSGASGSSSTPDRDSSSISTPAYHSIGYPPVPLERLIPSGVGVFIEIDKSGIPIRIWRYDYGLGLWTSQDLTNQRLTQTDVLRWPIPVLAVTGTLMIGVGIYVYRKGCSPTRGGFNEAQNDR
jgi:hypothetical protein